ncbi:unnamed protein product [Effrenium voratum]|nr:unnamed protein product [Effrenium voratum]
MDDSVFQQPEQPKTSTSVGRPPQAAPTNSSKSSGPSIAFSAPQGARDIRSSCSRTSSRLSLAQQEDKKRGCLWRCMKAQSQQPDTSLFLPYWFYGYCSQLVLTVSVLVIFFGLGVVLLIQSGSMHEVIIPYTSDLAEQEFSIDRSLEGDVLVYYEMHLWANHKSFVQSRDKRTAYNFLSTADCSQADTLDWASFRRGQDAAFMAKIGAAGPELLPCGLVSISMFTDNFTFHKSTNGGWERLDADSSDVALPSDAAAFAKLQPEGGGRLYIQSDTKIASWLMVDQFEHWKVWQRTPVAPSVHNLWAVIKGGLAPGNHKVVFEENSAIWHEWGVAEKRLVFTTRHSLGNKGALVAAGGFCLTMAIMEVFALISMLAASRLGVDRRLSVHVQPEGQP